jgi:hypothetical protein
MEGQGRTRHASCPIRFGESRLKVALAKHGFSLDNLAGPKLCQTSFQI